MENVKMVNLKIQSKLSLRPALVTTTFVKPCLICDGNFFMKSYRKRPQPFYGLPNWTFLRVLLI